MNTEQFSFNNQENKKQFYPVFAEERRFLEENLTKQGETKNIIGAITSYLLFKNGRDLSAENYLKEREKEPWIKQFEKDILENPRFNKISFDNLTVEECEKIIDDYEKQLQDDNSLEEKEENK